MKVIVKFSELKYRKKLKELGKFFEQNQEFIIEIDRTLDTDQKVRTFVEETVHFLVRIVSHYLNKKINVMSEEELAKLITGLIFTKISQNNKNGKKLAKRKS
jgi:lipopolysaccharide biosynthesis regulator YciM